MATSTKGLFSNLSNEQLKQKEQDLRSEVRQLGSAIEDEREELDRLKERLRKGDRSVEDQIDAVRETIDELQGKRSTKRARLETARRKRRSGISSTASGPSYSL